MKTKTKPTRELIRRNYVFPFELRAQASEGEAMVIEGYAVVFDQVADINGWFKEVVRRGACTKTLQENDQVALWDHETAMPLARKSAGTLELREEEHGLWMKATLDPEITYHKDAYRSVQRKDVQGMSFGFDIVKESYNHETDLYEILEIRLHEVSPCTMPAYEGTEVHARAVMDDEQARAVLEKRRGETTSEPDAATTPDAEPEPDHSQAGAIVRALLQLKATRRQKEYGHEEKVA